jgi:predicted tellurium resistance membrane protein TerC
MNSPSALASLSRTPLFVGIRFSLINGKTVHMDFFSTENIVSLLTLTFLEIVLGIDNIVFISIVSSRLPAAQQKKAQAIGIGLAFLGRIILLLTITWIIGLSKPFMHINDFALSYRDLILILGGLFLVGKSTSEIHKRIEGTESHKEPKKLSMASALLQILLLDVVFSLDSIITAIGLSDVLLTMIIAIVISLGIMLLFMRHVSEFIQKHPAMKILAISFLIMIGTVLVIEGLHVHVPKGYIYVSMSFALGIEFLNMWIRKKSPEQPAVKESVVAPLKGKGGKKGIKV